MTSTTDSKASIIRALNNQCRATFAGCNVVMTAAVVALDPTLQAKVMEAVRTFDDFNADNDPHHEADMAFFEIEGERYFWKFDYYDSAMEFGSDDPSNPAVTRRVLTVGLASDY